jgi:hypothetical protein
MVVDLIELSGLWLAAGDWDALSRTLRRLDAELTTRFAHDGAFAARFRRLLNMVEQDPHDTQEVRRAYRRASVG